MKASRRTFIQRIAGAGSAMFIPPFLQSAVGQNLLYAIQQTRHSSMEKAVADEDFWRLVQQAYTVSPTLINLNNGGVSPQPKAVQEAVEHYNRMSNQMPSYHMWRILDAGREPMRQQLAALAGCSAEEIAINRNTSEALETVIFGLRLQRGDEVVLSRYDYPNMMNAWNQRAHRDGVVLKWVELELPCEDKELLVRKYVEAFSPRTKLVHITHLVNWSGQILPAREIALEARKQGIEVLVDGAHSFAHLEFKVPELMCDYFGTSLHKWLCAPFGSGMLYVKREKIKNLYPLLAAPDPEDQDIRKFENLGTRSFAIEEGIAHAIQFHKMIGIERKSARLHFLKNYWAEKAAMIPGVTIGTSLKRDFGGALALLQIAGKDPETVAKTLFNDYKIHVVSIQWQQLAGVRVTPHIYTMLEDLDKFLLAIGEIARSE